MTIKPLLDFIGAHESRGDYNIVYGGIPKSQRPAKPLTQMTVGEVLKWQDFVVANGAKSSAAGKYQVIRKTLRGTYASAGLSLNSLYDEAGQDAIAVQLMNQRGLGAYLAGQLGLETFCNNLAREWASLPLVSGPKAGRSAYDGDGLNKALVNVKPFMDAVRAARGVDASEVSASYVDNSIGAVSGTKYVPVQPPVAPPAPSHQDVPTSPPVSKKPGSLTVWGIIGAALSLGLAVAAEHVTAWWQQFVQAVEFWK